MNAVTQNLVTLLLAGALSACDSSPTTTTRSIRTRALGEANGIRLENLTDRASAYFLYDNNALALIEWTPCVSQAPECLRLPAKGSVLVPFSEIVAGGAQSREVAIYTWWVVPDDTGRLGIDMDVPIILKL